MQTVCISTVCLRSCWQRLLLLVRAPKHAADFAQSALAATKSSKDGAVSFSSRQFDAGDFVAALLVCSSWRRAISGNIVTGQPSCDSDAATAAVTGLGVLV